MTNIICENMKQFLLTILLVFFFSISQSFGQCRVDVTLGKTNVVNGDFSQGYTGWTFTPDGDGDLDTPIGSPDGYKIFTGGFSVPGHIYVGTGADMYGFNNAFNKPFNGHTTGAADDKFLMVDGVCKTNIKLWEQINIPVAPDTRYYFSVWINSLKNQPNYPGLLNFSVDGVDLAGGIIIAPTTGGGELGGAWKKVESFWDSGPTPPATVSISIDGNQTVGCGGNTGESDFAIDDISFIPGCQYGAPGPQPDLGPDQSLCGKGGSITLFSNVPKNATTTVTWSDGETGTGLTAPYNKVITLPGTYAVCVTDGVSCTKSDVIVISPDFFIATGGPYNFCSTVSQALDPGFTGIGVTYKWYKDNVNLNYDKKVFTATSPGTYKVEVTVVGCGMKSATSIVTTSSPVTGINAYYCATLGPVSGLNLQATNTNSANLSWYSVPTGGTAIVSADVTTPNATTTQYSLPEISQGTTGDITYYVEDNSKTNGIVGPLEGSLTGSFEDLDAGNAQGTRFGIEFTANQAFEINSLQIPIRINQTDVVGMTITSIELEVRKKDGTVTSITATSDNTAIIIPPADSPTFAFYTFTFSNFLIDPSLAGVGNNLRLKIKKINTNYSDYRYKVGGRTSISPSPYPFVSSINPNVLNITGTFYDNPNQTNKYFGLYNWNISAKTPCSRTPVRAINNCVTPVTWTSFYLVPQNNACKLVWNTANEKNNAYFSVQRSSDGIYFETIGTITGAGNRDIASNYYYVDNNPLSGSSYYRITQVDYDGKSSSTDMKAYSSEGSIQLITYPNPFQNSTNIIVTGPNAETYTYTIYAVSGQLVEEGTGTINQLQTIAEKHAKGMYMLTVITARDIITTKIVKQ